jgi:hypothetical protein
MERRHAKRDDDLALAALERRHGAADRRTPRTVGALRRDAAAPARARRRQPALRRAVRADAARAARRRRSGSGNAPGADRGAAGHAGARPQDTASGRGRPRQGVLVGSAGGCRRARRRGGTRRPPRARAPGSSPAVEALFGRRAGRVRIRPRARPRGRLRADSAGRAGRTSTRRRPTGSRRSQAIESRSTRSCSLTICAKRSRSRGPRAATPRRSPIGRVATSFSRANVRAVPTSAGRKRSSSRRSSSRRGTS